MICACVRRLERQIHAGRQIEPAGQFRHLFLDMRFDLGLGVIEGGGDQIFEGIEAREQMAVLDFS